MSRRFAAAAVITAIGLSACAGMDDDATSDVGDESADIAQTEDAAGDSGGDETFADDAEAPVDTAAPTDSDTSDATDATDATVAEPQTAGRDETGAPIDLTFGRDLIVDAGVTMVTPDVGTAVDDVIDIAGRNGGAVFNADVTVEDPLEDGSVPGGGSIVIRIPPQQLDLLVRDLSGVGTLRNQSQSVDDVTDRLIDLDIQIRQALESVERMEALLAETTDFDALVAAETELSQRQIAYERLLAAKRNVDDRVALSTLTVNIQYQSPAIETQPAVEGTDEGIADAFSDGWNAFVGLLFGIAYVLAVTAPFIAVGLVVALAAWLVTRRIRRSRSKAINRHEPMDGPTPDAATSAWPEPAGEPVADQHNRQGAEAVSAPASDPDAELADASRSE